jgi:hypothetical protein
MFVTIKKHTLIITLVIGVVALMWFVLVAHGAESTFACGTGQNKLNLTISSSVRYNDMPYPSTTWTLKNLVPTSDRFFNFGDIKPGDEAQHRIGIRVENNSAYVCLDFNNLTDFENNVSESELLVDATPSDGELSEAVYFFAWRDANSDNIFTVGETPLFGNEPMSARSVLAKKSYALADTSTGTVYPKNSTHYIGIAWCAGEMTVDVSTAEVHCNGEAVGNNIQTDSMTFDVSVRAVSTTGQPKFYCKPKTTELPPGQCPYGFKKIEDDYKGGPSWTSNGAYSVVVLVGGPDNKNNKDPDGRNKYFHNVLAGETLTREAHDISHVCVMSEVFFVQNMFDTKKLVQNTTPPKPDWKPITPTPATILKDLSKGALKKLGI